MNPLTALLADILATGDWQRLEIVAEYLLATMTASNYAQRSADAAWLRDVRVETCNYGEPPGRFHYHVQEGDHLKPTDEGITHEVDAIAELFRRVAARFGLVKVKCVPCNGAGCEDTHYDDAGSWVKIDPCPHCGSRSWNLSPVERVPCQRCGGKWRCVQGWTTVKINNIWKKCPDCQGQGTVTKESITE